MRFYILLLLSLMTATAHAQSNQSFDLQGHRGCRGLMPENTIPAFLKALDLGVSTVELDVVISKDKQVVVSHEPYFNADFSSTPDGKPVDKKTQKQLNLYLMEYDEIKRYDVGSKGNPNYPDQEKIQTYKPLLREVITALEAYRQEKNLPAFSYNIEVKSETDQYDVSQPKPAEFSDLTYAVIAEQLPPERVIVQSFDFNVLKYWKQQIDAGTYKKVKLSALVADLKSVDTHLRDLGFTPDIYSPYFRLLGQEKVNRLHEKGIKVVPWTVNNVEEMKKMKNWGVDGIITDYPNRAKGI